MHAPKVRPCFLFPAQRRLRLHATQNGVVEAATWDGIGLEVISH